MYVCELSYHSSALVVDSTRVAYTVVSAGVRAHRKGLVECLFVDEDEATAILFSVLGKVRKFHCVHLHP